MKLAIVGSRDIKNIFIAEYLPTDVTEIVSGGAKGVDTIAKNYALSHNLKYTEFLPDYKAYGRAAPLRRNDEIIEYADEVLAFWNGKSRGTKYVIERTKALGKKVGIVRMDKNRNIDEYL